MESAGIQLLSTTDNDKTNDGTGTGAFKSSVSGLAAGVTYYVRAYAQIVLVQYGNEWILQPSDAPPSAVATMQQQYQYNSYLNGSVNAFGNSTCYI